MSYQERRVLVSLISTVIITVLYGVFALQRYPESSAYSTEVYRFWGSAIVLLIVVSIVAKVIIHILFSVLHTVVTKEAEPDFTDERDRTIELRATRNALYVFTIGFLLAMIAVALDMPPAVMFAVLILAGLLSDAVSDLTQFLLYRRGF